MEGSAAVAGRRSCGDCQACCVAFEIHGLSPPKPSNARCSHQCAAGCSIWTKKPVECRDYSCLWLADDGSALRDAERPDKSGIIVDALPFGSVAHPDLMSGERRGFRVTEVARGASNLPWNRTTIERLVAHPRALVVLSWCGSMDLRWLLTPTGRRRLERVTRPDARSGEDEFLCLPEHRQRYLDEMANPSEEALALRQLFDDLTKEMTDSERIDFGAIWNGILMVCQGVEDADERVARASALVAEYAQNAVRFSTPGAGS